MKKLMIALVAFTCATSVLAEEAQEAPAPPAKEKKICRTEKITGSRSRVRRTCLTRAQWDEIAEATRKNMNDFYRESNSTGPAISDGAGQGPKIPN